MVKVLVKRLNSKVKLPEYKTSGSSGMDLMAFVNSPIKIEPNTLELIPTGLSPCFWTMQCQQEMSRNPTPTRSSCA